MERKKHLRHTARLLTATAALLLVIAAVWDGVRLKRAALSPQVSYVLVALAVALATAAVLGRVLGRGRARARNALELLASGMVLLAWWLRGDALIPADAPLVAAEALGALVLAASALLPLKRSRD